MNDLLLTLACNSFRTSGNEEKKKDVKGKRDLPGSEVKD
jgi:hypothetical protein